MKKIILFGAILLLAAGCFKQPENQVINYPTPTPTPVVTPTPVNNDWQTYTNSTSGFSIKYPADFTVVNPTKIQAQQVSYIPVCNPDVALCLLLGQDKYKNTNFEGAGVSVNILSDLNTEAKCFVYTDESRTHVADVVINGVTFKSATGGGAAAGHSDKQQIYRNFYNGKCYEITQDVTQSNIQNYEPGTVKEYNQDEVWQKLQGIVNTFKFISSAESLSLPIKYDNKQYGFTFSLPQDWKGYKILSDSWTGIVDGKVSVTGPIVIIRSPKWTSTVHYQDIPITIFTLQQYNDINEGKYFPWAGGVPIELGRNAKFVFIINSRYGAAEPAGRQEVEKVFANNPFKAY